MPQSTILQAQKDRQHLLRIPKPTARIQINRPMHEINEIRMNPATQS
jgi:hypothetical protein